MHPFPHAPNLAQVATQAQNLAQATRQERMALAFQTVSMVSMALMGATAAAHLIRTELRPERGKGRER